VQREEAGGGAVPVAAQLVHHGLEEVVVARGDAAAEFGSGVLHVIQVVARVEGGQRAQQLGLDAAQADASQQLGDVAEALCARLGSPHARSDQPLELLHLDRVVLQEGHHGAEAAALPAVARLNAARVPPLPALVGAQPAPQLLYASLQGLVGQRRSRGGRLVGASHSALVACRSGLRSGAALRVRVCVRADDRCGGSQRGGGKLTAAAHRGGCASRDAGR